MDVLAPSITVIGLGNSMAADDGVGPWIVSEMMKSKLPPDVALELLPAPGPELLLLLENSGEYWFIDAAKDSEKPPGTVIHQRIVAGDDAELVPVQHLVSTHGLSMAELLRLASILGKRRATIELWGIVGEIFEAGDRLSSPVKDAAEKLVHRLLDRLAEGSKRRTAD